ncbi:HAD-IA family hydrolase [Streptococcus sp. zg-86]|uniref:HAD-IA family hydrolase n=1 Tax=Streptococcus zhangguiae TaxID=2664091 RepID=A0A6I4RUV9_9STRE|nr:MULTISPECIES: HAD-IA family hydrolase [unclassified Streptococcus]MTB65105.1 HAD-IA family hydrolase [Streptococcus sp. zg-86]MTB91365.1 HAD-IA family hydrolase [Streptococcus sp. zg-36]MWV57092.1 HAD-IA family hydrolase [Streptococcus sp. zg-70]QTH47834.1 HAD-IA family hydrolase [Streptococcus sp. zg-86]
MKKAFIWDLDGTLLDSYDAILLGLEEMYSHFGLTFYREEVKAFILRYSVKELLLQLSQKEQIPLEELNAVRANSLREKNAHIQLMEGAREILEWGQQAGIAQFVYTHKGDNAFAVLDDLGISEYFVEVLTGDSGFARKPHPEAIVYLMEKYDLSQKATYYIGDRLLDAETAQAAGIKSLNLTVASSTNNTYIESLLAIKEVVG